MRTQISVQRIYCGSTYHMYTSHVHIYVYVNVNIHTCICIYANSFINFCRQENYIYFQFYVCNYVNEDTFFNYWISCLYLAKMADYIIHFAFITFIIKQFTCLVYVAQWKLPLRGRITCRHCRQPKLPNFLYSSNSTSWWLMRQANNNNNNVAQVVQMKAASSQADHLPTLSIDKASDLSLLVKSPLVAERSMPALLLRLLFQSAGDIKWTMDRFRHQHPLTVYDWCKGTRTESVEK